MTTLICQSLNKIRSSPGKSRPMSKEYFVIRILKIVYLPTFNLCVMFLSSGFFLPFFFLILRHPTFCGTPYQQGLTKTKEPGCERESCVVTKPRAPKSGFNPTSGSVTSFL